MRTKLFKMAFQPCQFSTSFACLFVSPPRPQGKLVFYGRTIHENAPLVGIITFNGCVSFKCGCPASALPETYVVSQLVRNGRVPIETTAALI